MRVALLLTATFFALLAEPAGGENLVARRFEARYNAAHTLVAAFLERYSENGRVVRVEAGTAYFRRPGKMRWEYQSPEKNLFLVDGKTAWFYVPGDHTVIEVPAKKSGDWRTPLALLAGEVKVSHLCSSVQVATTRTPMSSENALLYCAVRGPSPGTAQKPESNPSSVEVHDAVFFEIARETGQLVRILVLQSGGIELEFRFANWQFDPQLPELLFHFAPPIGVTIVTGELPAENSVMR